MPCPTRGDIFGVPRPASSKTYTRDCCCDDPRRHREHFALLDADGDVRRLHAADAPGRFGGHGGERCAAHLVVCGRRAAGCGHLGVLRLDFGWPTRSGLHPPAHGQGRADRARGDQVDAMSAAAQSPLPASLHDADWLKRPGTQAVFVALAAHGHEARAVGGAVRDALLGRRVGDVDLATPARPEAVMAAAQAAGLKAIATGLAHGTVTVLAEGLPYEITTLREDVESYGRHAKVAFTADWAADARRRDFTINALYCGADGELFDPLGGWQDLVQRRVRFIGEASERIREDYLRILRFFRFGAEYGDGPPDRQVP